MYIKDLPDCETFLAGEHTWLKELLHPDKEPLQLRYSLTHAVVKPGLSSTSHRMFTSEVYYILEGEGLMHIGEEQAPVRAGMTIYIPPGEWQHITNTGHSDLVFLCIVDPAWREEDEEVR